MSSNPIVPLDDDKESLPYQNAVSSTQYPKYSTEEIVDLRKKRRKWRWISLIVGWFMMSVSGTQYLYSVISPDLKDIFSYTQSEINLVGTFSNFGLYFFGVGVGLFYDKFGFRWTAIVGSVFMGTGYLCIWLLAQEAQPHFIIVAGYLCLMGTGSSGAYTSALGTNVKNAPPHQVGLVAGILVSGFGLCASIFTGIYKLFFRGDVIALLLFLSIALAIIPLFGAVFLRAQNYDPEIDDPNYSVTPETALTKETVTAERIEARCVRDISYFEMIKTVEFYLVFTIFGVLAGAGFVIFINLGSLVKSLGGKNGEQDNYVIVLSIFNFLARIIVGILGDRTRPYFSRPWYLFFISVLMSATMFLLAFAGLDALWLGVMGTGLGYGSLMAVTPVFLSEYFGNTYFGGNWGIVRASPGLGSFFLATLLAGKLYESNTEPGEKDCYGDDCYYWVFLICTALCMGCAVLSLWLIKRARPVYLALSGH